MKKLILKTIIIFILIFSVSVSISFATSSNTEDMLNEIQKQVQNIDINNITEDDILKLYDDLSNNYTSEDLAEIIEENKSELQKQGISEEIIDAGTEILKTTDSQTIKDILENDINISEIQEKLESGQDIDRVLQKTVSNIPTKQKINIAIKLFLANKIVKTIIVILVALFIYSTIIRWKLYKKAGEHAWASIIPIYRDIVMYKISDISPFVMLLWLIPIIGWGILFIILLVKRVCIATNFGRGPGFAFGNMLFPIIFESIIAFNPNIQYEEKV